MTGGSAAFKVTLSSIVQDIKRLLDETYVIDRHNHDILPIVKEALQNANDADASEVILRFYQTGFLPGAAHNSLLTGPGLLIANNGEFRPEDLDALGSISVTTKAEDGEAIGRFGLGTKSVFHLADAFFAVGAHPKPPGGPPEPLSLNRAIWVDPHTGRHVSTHDNWNAFSASDVKGIESVVPLEWRNSQTWFAMWLPLRTRDHQPWVTLDWFPDCDRLAGRFLSDEASVAALLPQLWKLRCVRVELWTAPQGEKVRGFEARVDDTKRGELRATGKSRPRRSDSIRVTWAGDQGEGELEGVVVEHEEDASLSLEQDKFRDDWPTRTIIDAQDGQRRVKDKAFCHGAITILREKRRTGADTPQQSKWAWAVFLPLAEQRLKSGGGRSFFSGEYTWRLWFHGYFFPDSGRKHPAGFEPRHDTAPQDETTEVRPRWNAFVRDAATLPCLVPALAQAVKQVSIDEAEALIAAVGAIPEVQARMGIVGRDRSLIVGPSGDTHAAIQVVARADRLIALPRPTAVEWKGCAVLVKELKDAMPGTVVLWEEAPRLSAADAARLSGAEWSNLARRDAFASALRDGAARQYLVRCIAGLPPELQASVARACLREALGRLTFRSLEAKDWQPLAALAKGATLVIECTNTELLEFLKLNTDVLVLQGQFYPTSPGRPQLTDADVRVLSDWVTAKMKEEPASNVASSLIRAVVEAAGINRFIHGPNLAHAPVVPVHSTAHGRRFVGLSDLKAALDRRTVFASRGVKSPLDVAAKFARATAREGEGLLLLESDDWLPTLTNVGWRIPDLQLRTMLELLADDTTSLSANQADRLPLLKAILDSSLGKPDSPARPETGRAIQRLLAGRSSGGARQFRYIDPGAPPRTQNLIERILENWGQSSCCIPGSVEARREWRDSLEAERVDTRTLIELLDGLEEYSGIETLRGLTDQDLTELRDLLARYSDGRAWRNLHVHPTNKGLRSLGGSVFLSSAQASWPVPGRLEAVVAFLIESPQAAEPYRTRLRKDVPPFQAREQLATCLGWPTPETLWREILDALEALGIACNSDAKLLVTPWLPLTNHRACAPSGVVLVPPSVDAALDATAWREGIVTERRILDEARAHPGFATVRALLDDRAGQPAWEVRIVTELQSLSPLPELPVNFARGSHVDALLGAAQGLELPGLGLLFAMSQTLTAERWSSIREPLALRVSGEMSPATLVLLLSNRGFVERARGAWLELLRCAAAGVPDFATAILPHLELLNQCGALVSPTQLARSATHIDPVHLMHREVEATLVDSGWMERFEEDEAPAQPVYTDLRVLDRPALQQWALDWKNATQEPRLVAAVLVLLGESEPYRAWDIARSFNDDASPERILAQLLARNGRGVETAGIEATWLRQALYHLELVTPGQSVRVQALTGTTFTSRVLGQDGQTVSISTGDVPRLGRSQNPRRRPSLKLLPPPRGASAQVVAGSLCRSIEELIQRQLGDKAPEPNRYLSELIEKPGESRIRVVRAKVTRDMPLSLQSLRKGAPPVLREALTAFEEAERRNDEATQGVEELSSGVAFSEAERKHRLAQAVTTARAVEERRKVIEALVLIDGPDHETVRMFLLDTLRRRLSEYQYAPEQVLFELAQNADDALGQLIGASKNPSVLIHNHPQESRLDFIHFGRGMDDTQGLPVTDVKYGPFSRDLINLTRVNFSEKDESSTGRFGIGFKSVYLITNDPPEIVSGSLSFRIRAGIVPESWSPTEEVRQRAGHSGTMIRLRVGNTPEFAAAGEAARKRFQGLGGLMPLFARNIRRVEWHEGVDSQVSDWRPRTLHDSGVRLEVGDVRPDLGGPLVKVLTVGTIDIRAPATLVLQLSAAGFTRFSADIPTLWWTTPTRELWNAGILLGGPFEVDVGRNNIARENTANQKVFALLGTTLERGLHELWNHAASGGDEFLRDLGLGTAARAAHRLWTSLFSLLSDVTLRDKAPPVLAGYAKFLNAQNVVALPAGLTGPWDVLTDPGKVKWVVARDLLATGDGRTAGGHGSLWAAFAEMSWVRERFGPGTVVGPETGAFLSAQRLRTDLRELTLTTLLSSAVGNNNVLHALIASELDFLRRRSIEGVLPEGLAAQFRDWARRVRVQGRSGDDHSPDEMVLPDTPAVREAFESSGEAADVQDEWLRSGFAPVRYLLSLDWESRSGAVRFFRFLRARMDANTQRLALWARSAQAHQRVAVLTYILRGELSRQLALEFQSAPIPWCSTPTHLRELAGAGHLDYLQLLTALFPKQVARLSADVIDGLTADAEEQFEEVQDDPIPAEVGLRTRSPADFLRRVQTWWHRDSQEALAEWERQVYPEGWSRNAFRTALRSGAGTPESRSAWMTLLTLGACHRFGRQTRAQHRGFLQTLQRERQGAWWATIIGENAGTEDWMRILDQWMEAQVAEETWAQWFALFPTLRRFSRHLGVYAHLFLALGDASATDSFDFDTHLQPRANPALSGSGIEAPPVARTLGQGASFVVRELIRLELLEPSPALGALAWVPQRATREMLVTRGFVDPLDPGWQARSRAISQFIGRHAPPGSGSFDGAFDLALVLFRERQQDDASNI